MEKMIHGLLKILLVQSLIDPLVIVYSGVTHHEYLCIVNRAFIPFNDHTVILNEYKCYFIHLFKVMHLSDIRTINHDGSLSRTMSTNYATVADNDLSTQCATQMNIA